MKIKTAKIENFKRIKFAEIAPNERGVYVIGGKNGNGKSSLIDALITSLGGKKFAPKEPVRRGSEKSKITVTTTDDFEIRQYFTPEGAYGLQVKRADGAVYPQGQTFLDQFYSRLSFDPLAFLRMTEKDQIATLKSAIGLDFSELDFDREQAYTARTEVNRDVKRIEAEIAGIEYDPSVPSEAVSISTLAEKLRAANASNAERSRLITERDSLDQQINGIDTRVAELKAEIDRLTAGKTELVRRKDEAAAKAAATERIDTAEIEAALNDADNTNRQIERNARRAALQADLMKVATRSKELTARIERIDNEKSDLIAKAKVPVPGLTFTDEGLYMNSVPFSQASQAEKLRASFALAFAQKTGLEVVFSADGSLLDPESLAILDDEATRAGFQVILERVGEDENTSIVIEDGEVRGAEKPKAAEELFDE